MKQSSHQGISLLRCVPVRQQFGQYRFLVLTFFIALVIGSLYVPGSSLLSVRAQPQLVGLTTEFRKQDEKSVLVIRSPERFELHLDERGIVAWYDLQREPEQRMNLVPDTMYLLEHRRTTDGALFRGTPTIQDESPVQVRVVWEGQANTASQPATIEYTIWAGGQVAVTLQSTDRYETTLQREPDAITGAALQKEAPTTDGDIISQTMMLFLDAWTGEDSEPLTQDMPIEAEPPSTGPQLAETGGATVPLSYDPQRGAVQAEAIPGQPVRLRLPTDAGLRQPRFEITNWTSADLTVRRGATVLVAGQDYLADWDAATQELTLQYLRMLPASPDAEGHTFELSAAPAAATLRLGVDGRDLDENGLLEIDANMPDENGNNSTADTFKIPYIQSSSDFEATATLQGGGAGVEFVLTLADLVWITKDTQSPYAATFNLPSYGEYRLEGYILDTSGNRLNSQPDAVIDPVGYGHILLSVGDSITAGFGGNEVTSGNTNYPVVTWEQSPSESEDRRNIFQYDNKRSSGHPYRRGYQVNLNDQLTQCSDAPVFILNDGFGGIRTAEGGNKSVLSKMSSYNDHIDKLGVDYLLLQVGTNDASSGLAANSWEEDINQVIDAFQSANSGLNIWMPLLPKRYDSIDKDGLIVDYNDRIPGIVDDQNSSGNPVRDGPDFYELFDDNPGWLDDDLHPNQTGYNEMAKRWDDVICSVLPDPAPLPTVTATPTNTPTTTPTATNTPILTSTSTNTPDQTPTTTAMPVTPTTVPSTNENRMYVPLAG